MFSYDLTQHSLWINVAILAAGCVGVWLAGSRLSELGDVISDRTGLGQAFTGALLLGLATSLPELATTLTASLRGAGALAGSNLLGGVAMQLAVLAVVDGIGLRRRALTFVSPHPVLLLQGVLLILLIALAAAAIATGGYGYSLWGVGLWSPFLLGFYLLALWVHYRFEGGRPRWEALEQEEPPEPSRSFAAIREERFGDKRLRRVIGFFALAGLGVLVSGYVVARAGEALAEQSGLGGTFVGATLVAIATSLPEMSTTLAAVRGGAYAMAIGNIFGTNALEIALLPIADVSYREGVIYESLETSAIVLCSLGIVVTGLYLWGLIERRNRTVFGLGQDSFLVLIAYGLGLVVFHFAGG